MPQSGMDHPGTAAGTVAIKVSYHEGGPSKTSENEVKVLKKI